MEESYKNRKLFRHTNIYQRQIIKLTLIPVAALCALISVFLLRFRFELIDMVLYGSNSPSLEFIDQWFVIIIIALWSIFFVVTYLSYRVSLKLVGAFERVIKELDGVITGDSRHPITARDEDFLANALLRRVNILIDNLPLPKAPLRIR